MSHITMVCKGCLLEAHGVAIMYLYATPLLVAMRRKPGYPCILQHVSATEEIRVPEHAIREWFLIQYLLQIGLNRLRNRDKKDKWHEIRLTFYFTPACGLDGGEFTRSW